jgi:hypothetical protein
MILPWWWRGSFSSTFQVESKELAECSQILITVRSHVNLMPRAVRGNPQMSVESPRFSQIRSA